MIAKLTSKNQLTLPKAVIQQISTDVDVVDYFSVVYEGGKIVLTPVAVVGQTEKADAVRNKLALLGITEDHVTEAISWARERKS